MIIFAATPIGNLADHSPRLVEAIGRADVIVAEDTRSAKSLFGALGLHPHQPIRAMHEHNEREVVDELIAQARTQDILVLTDAGTPGISDPGYVIASRAHAAGVPVSVIPGPSAVIVALIASGLPTDRFCFEGFVPKKGRQEFLAQLATERRTMVFFESPHRLGQTLAEMADAWGGDRRACVCRELTKKFEQVRQDTLAVLAEEFSEGARGEITLVVAGAPSAEVSVDEALRMVAGLVEAGAKVTDATRDVASSTGLSKRILYDAWAKRDA